MDPLVQKLRDEILTLEQFLMACNRMTGPMGLAEGFLKGVQLLATYHDRLLKDLGPDEVQKLRDDMNPKKKEAIAPALVS